MNATALAAEAIQRAAAAANQGYFAEACALLADAEAMVGAAPSTLQGDSLSERLVDALSSALRRLEKVSRILQPRRPHPYSSPSPPPPL